MLQQIDAFLLHGLDEGPPVVGKILFAHVDEGKGRIPVCRSPSCNSAAALCLLVGTGRSLQDDEQIHVAVGTGVPSGPGPKQDQPLQARSIDLPETPRGPAQRLLEPVGYLLELVGYRWGCPWHRKGPFREGHWRSTFDGYAFGDFKEGILAKPAIFPQLSSSVRGTEIVTARERLS